MDITDKGVTVFLNDQVRPMSEAARAFKLQLDALILDFDQKVAPLLGKAASDDTINDGRDMEGVPLRTFGELQTWLGVFRKIVAIGADQWPDDTISKFCVRKLTVN